MSRFSPNPVDRLRRIINHDQITLTLLAMAVGAVTGGGVIVFRDSIIAMQSFFFGEPGASLWQDAALLPWWQVIAVLVIGGAVIGLACKFLMPEGRPQGLADVIEASALRGGSMSGRVALKAALINAASLGFGASVGREGPAVHFGAALGSWLAQVLRLNPATSRTLLGCGAAAAVAASFNAPIAGALFASEVVLGHYALSAFAPIVIASVSATAVSRYYFGDFPAFSFPEHVIQSVWEYPAFMILGVIAGLTAVGFMKAIMSAADLAQRLALPNWLKPALGGLMVGLIALWFPHVLGVGYGVTESAVMVAFPLGMLLAILMAKIVATVISIGFGFGGGVFSPALVIGAMLGGAYGTIFTVLFPSLSTGIGAYSILGMGAVTAAVLGAPISTALIVFEMTGDYALTLALMVTVVIASLITREFHGGSFFIWQLERQGHDLRDGLEMALLRKIPVNSILSAAVDPAPLSLAMPEIRCRLQTSEAGELFVIDQRGGLVGTITLADLDRFAFDGELDSLLVAGDVARRLIPHLISDDTLETALDVMADQGKEYLPVVDNNETMILLGSLRESRVRDAYNRALLQSQREQRGF